MGGGTFFTVLPSVVLLHRRLSSSLCNVHLHNTICQVFFFSRSAADELSRSLSVVVAISHMTTRIGDVRCHKNWNRPLRIERKIK